MLGARCCAWEVAPETYALVRQAMAILERERGEHLDDDALISALSRQVIEGHGSAVRDHAPYQIAVTICETCKRGWQDGGGVTVEMSPPAIERAWCDAEHIGSLDGGIAERATQTVPPAIRRTVARRDHGRCRVPGCRSRRNIDVHHIVPRAAGGTHDVDNLCLLCESHHLALHDGSLVITGEAPALIFTRRSHGRFENERHAVDTAKALAALGFKKAQIADALRQTRSRVATRGDPPVAPTRSGQGDFHHPALPRERLMSPTITRVASISDEVAVGLAPFD